MSQPESKLSRDIMAALRARGIFCFKIHGGPTMMAGLPDIIACVPISAEVDYGTYVDESNLGLFVGFETKTPTGGDPTPVQEHVHFRIGEAYGKVFVVRSVQDAVDAIETIGGHMGTQPLG